MSLIIKLTYRKLHRHARDLAILGNVQLSLAQYWIFTATFFEYLLEFTDLPATCVIEHVLGKF